jgi:hypothetical protein
LVIATLPCSGLKQTALKKSNIELRLIMSW